jgi:glycosyltransferase involved in cell wall biosynthesis/ADP-heptose:LPS heptosyltransferase
MSLVDRLPLGIVTPWFGRGLKGGAERHAWELAARFAARGHRVEVLTTCCRSHQDNWAENHFAAGTTVEPEGFSVRRFPVESRNREAFDRVNGLLMNFPVGELKRAVSPVSSEDEAVFAEELIRSPELLAHLAAQSDSYRALIFLPYLYFSSLRGVPLAGRKAILIPCLHREAYAFLPVVAHMFRSARQVLFLSEGERRLALSYFGPGLITKSAVAGGGVDTVQRAARDDGVDTLALQPFVLCLGRQDPGKNTDFLASAYARFRERHPDTALRLVLAGPGGIVLPSDATGIVQLGAVSEGTKADLLAACTALFNPSANESYSRVMMEAWREGKPVAAHRDCLATATAVEAAGGGWRAATAEDWIGVFEEVAGAEPSILVEMGQRGRWYAEDLANWERAIERYERAVDLVDDGASPAPSDQGAIHQVLPNLVAGDAISNEAVWIKRRLQAAGYDARIYAIHVDPRVAPEAILWQPGCLDPNATLLYHHSIASAVTQEVCSHRGPKALIYHNITPDKFLADYLPLNSHLCREARAQLGDLAVSFPISVGDSNYNAIELAERGFSDPGVLPLCVDPGKWSMAPDPELMKRMQDGSRNLLFVGRLSPNKRQEDLIVAFAHYRQLEPNGRLHLVGSAASPHDLYLECLRQLAQQLGIAEWVNFAGAVSDAELMAYYLTADLFWSMSEHEGFCVPIIEAMWFDVPVFAYACTAIPETMGRAGSQFTSKADSKGLAEEAFALTHTSARREEVLARQRLRREAFLPAAIKPALDGLIQKLGFRSGPTSAIAAPPDNLEKIREIAVLKLDHIGDVLLATPVFFSLTKRFPEARITAVVAPAAAAILRGNPFVDRVVVYDAPWYWRELEHGDELRRRVEANFAGVTELSETTFDLIVNLRSDHSNVLFAASLPHVRLLSYTNDSAYPFLITHRVTRTRGMHATQQHRELLWAVGAFEWCAPAVYFGAAELRRAREVGSGDRGTVVFAMGAGVALKRWAPVKFKELARRLRLEGREVALVGSAADAAFSSGWDQEYGCLNLCGLFSLSELAAYLSECGCLVANDSAPMHVGAAAGIPVVHIIRPPVREEFEPIGVNHRGCARRACATPCQGFDPANREGIPQFCECVQSVTVDEVQSAVWDVLTLSGAVTALPSAS